MKKEPERKAGKDRKASEWEAGKDRRKEHYAEGSFLAEKLADLFYPPRCPLCAGVLPPLPRLRRECSWQELVCISCAKELPWIREPVCKKCGRPLEDDREEEEYCAQCARTERPYVEGRGVFSYRGALRRSVLQMKYYNRREWLTFFAAAMTPHAVDAAVRRGVRTIVPVPCSRKKKRQRGYDQSVLLAKQLSDRSGIRMCADSLIRTRDTRALSGLGMRERRENLEGAFTVLHAERLEEPVLLTDDIFTTGSTLEECCAALGRAGIREIYFLVLCIA